MQRLLIIRFSALGDILQIIPIIEALKRKKYEVHILTKEQFKPVFQIFFDDLVIHTISNHAGSFELFNKLKKVQEINFYRIYDLHRNIRSFLTCLYLKLRQPNLGIKRVSKQRLKELILFAVKSSLF